MVSLFAKKSLFVFDTKSNQKSQDNKDASTLPAGSSRFFRCSNTSYFHITQKAKPAFPPLRWPALVVRSHAFSFFPSVEQLRMKSGKTMAALCAMAGHSRFLQKGKGQSA